jgi:hypothetical protein
MEKIRIRDPGWKKVGFVIRNPVKHTESATLVTIAAGGISTATFPSPQPALHINNNVSQYKYWYAPNSHCCCHKSTTVALPSQQQLQTTVTTVAGALTTAISGVHVKTINWERHSFS